MTSSVKAAEARDLGEKMAMNKKEATGVNGNEDDCEEQQLAQDAQESEIAVAKANNATSCNNVFDDAGARVNIGSVNASTASATVSGPTSTPENKENDDPTLKNDSNDSKRVNNQESDVVSEENTAVNEDLTAANTPESNTSNTPSALIDSPADTTTSSLRTTPDVTSPVLLAALVPLPDDDDEEELAREPAEEKEDKHEETTEKDDATNAGALDATAPLSPEPVELATSTSTSTESTEPAAKVDKGKAKAKDVDDNSDSQKEDAELEATTTTTSNDIVVSANTVPASNPSGPSVAAPSTAETPTTATAAVQQPNRGKKRAADGDAEKAKAPKKPRAPRTRKPAEPKVKQPKIAHPYETCMSPPVALPAPLAPPPKAKRVRKLAEYEGCMNLSEDLPTPPASIQQSAHHPNVSAYQNQAVAGPGPSTLANYSNAPAPTFPGHGYPGHVDDQFLNLAPPPQDQYDPYYGHQDPNMGPYLAPPLQQGQAIGVPGPSTVQAFPHNALPPPATFAGHGHPGNNGQFLAPAPHPGMAPPQHVQYAPANAPPVPNAAPYNPPPQGASLQQGAHLYQMPGPSAFAAQNQNQPSAGPGPSTFNSQFNMSAPHTVFPGPAHQGFLNPYAAPAPPLAMMPQQHAQYPPYLAPHAPNMAPYQAPHLQGPPFQQQVQYSQAPAMTSLPQPLALPTTAPAMPATTYPAPPPQGPYPAYPQQQVQHTQALPMASPPPPPQPFVLPTTAPAMPATAITQYGSSTHTQTVQLTEKEINRRNQRLHEHTFSLAPGTVSVGPVAPGVRRKERSEGVRWA